MTSFICSYWEIPWQDYFFPCSLCLKAQKTFSFTWTSNIFIKIGLGVHCSGSISPGKQGGFLIYKFMSYFISGSFLELRVLMESSVHCFLFLVQKPQFYTYCSFFMFSITFSWILITLSFGFIFLSLLISIHLVASVFFLDTSFLCDFNSSFHVSPEFSQFSFSVFLLFIQFLFLVLNLI